MTEESASSVAEPEVETVTPEGSAPEGSEVETPEPETPASAAEGDGAFEDDPAFVRFAEKVIGDRDVDEKTARGMLGKEYWDQKNANTVLARERDEARREVQALKDKALATVSPRETPPAERPAAAAPKDPEIPPEIAPQMQKIDARLQGLANEHKSNREEHAQLLTTLAQKNREIGKLEGKLEVANDLDKPNLSIELRIIRDEFERGLIRGKWLMQRNSDLSFHFDRGQEDKVLLLKRVQEDQARQTQSKSDAARFDKEFPQQFDAELRAQAEEAGVPVNDEKTWMAVWRYVNNASMAELTSLRDTLVKDVDVPGLIGSKLKEWLDDHELAGKLRFGKQSEEKRTAAARLRSPVRVGARPAASPTAQTRKPWDDPPKTALDRARERINKSGW
jgi:hypothetical protein